MKVTNIHIVRRMPREEYGYEEVTINAELGAKDVPVEKLIELRQLAAEGLNALLEGEQLAVEVRGNSKDLKKVAKELKEETAKRKKSSKKKIDLEEDEDFGGDEDEEDDEEIQDFDAEYEDDLEGDEDEEEEAPKPKKKTSSKATGVETSAKKATKKKGKVTPYDREKELHKKIVGEMLDEAKPKWDKNADLVKRSRIASKNFDGEDFLDSEGSVLEDFRKEFLGFMKIKG